MQSESDSSLLYYMSCTEAADRVIASAAAKEFHRRHMRALYGRCTRLCKRMGLAASFAEDLASVALVKAVKASATFTDGPDATQQSARTKAWLGKIAWSLLVDLSRNPLRPGPLTGAQINIPLDDYSSEDFSGLYCSGKSVPRDQETIRLVRQAFEQLDDRTQKVMLHTILQRQRSPKGSYVYRGAAAKFAQELGTTPVNVRRIFGVGVRAIAIFVDSHRG